MKKGDVKDILSGDVLKKGWFRRQYKLILLIFGLLFMYIYAGYQGQRQQKRLNDLQKELQDARFEQLTINAQLVEQTRQSTIAAQLKAMGSTIEENKQPVTRVSEKN